MRERVKELRESREAERAQLAEEKKRQLFLEGSDKIRTLRQKQEIERIKVAREEQLQLEARKKAHARQVDAIYDHMWQEDIRAKEERERRDTEAARARTKEQYTVLGQQLAALAEARAYEKQLHDEEQRQMV